MLKHADTPQPFVNALKNVLTTIGVGLGVGVGFAGAGYLVDKAKKGIREGQVPLFLTTMLSKNPDLQMEYMSSKEKKEKIEDLFSLLEHMSPKLAENPLASGAFIRKLLTLEDIGPDIAIMETLSKITKNYADSDGGFMGNAIKDTFSKGTTSGYQISNSL